MQKQEGKDFGSTLGFKLKEGNISNSDFSWEEENKEFLYKEEMYDVVAMHIKGDTIIIRCYKDNKETDFRTNIMRYMKQIGAAEEAPAFIKLCIEDFIVEPGLCFEILTPLYNKIQYFDAAIRLSLRHSEISPRPPKLA